MTTTPDARTVFTSRLPEIECLAGSHLRHHDPDAREGAVQNSVVLAYRYWLRLAERGKTGDECFKSAVWWAAIHTKQVRKGGGCARVKGKCVMDYARRRKGDVAFQGGVNLNHFIGQTASIPAAVAFRVDTAAFMGTLNGSDREIARDLAAGMGTTEVARKRGVTPAAISQFRTRWTGSFLVSHRRDSPPPRAIRRRNPACVPASQPFKAGASTTCGGQCSRRSGG